MTKATQAAVCDEISGLRRLQSSGMLRRAYRRFGNTYRYHLQGVLFAGCLKLEEGTAVLTRNVAKQLQMYTAYHAAQMNEGLIALRYVHSSVVF